MTFVLAGVPGEDQGLPRGEQEAHQVRQLELE